MMSGRHLPAGPGIPIDTGKRRSYNQHQHQHQQYAQQPMYPAYMQTYGAGYFPHSVSPQYSNPQLPISYAQYQSFVRSPQIQQYVTSPPHQPQVIYSRSGHSNATPPIYKSLPPPSTSASSTRSSRSSNTVPASTPNTSKIALEESFSSPKLEPTVKSFRAPLPWFSRPELGWPERRTRKKRRPVQKTSTEAEAVKLPSILQASSIEAPSVITTSEAATTRPETPSTNHHASEDNSTNPSTPTSIHPSSILCDTETTPLKKNVQKSNVRTVPVVPALPKPFPRQTPNPTTLEKVSGRTQVDQIELPTHTKNTSETNNCQDIKVGEVIKEAEPGSLDKAWVTPKLWTGIFNPAVASTGNPQPTDRTKIASNFEKKDSKSLTEVLKSFNTNSNSSNVTFLEPRGLVNTGNMCYMNSILQVLLFCSLFLNFLDQVSKRAVCSLKNSTPLLDAMVLFMREYSTINTTVSSDQPRMRSRESDSDQFGESFTPDFFYNVINQLPRFSSMRRGHQQDAEEFLGFLLEGLHDECAQVIQSTSTNTNRTVPSSCNNSQTNAGETSPQSSLDNDKAWLEVGPKQKAAVTRSSGVIITETPVTKIFGGNLRSELRVPGLKDSVTMEPYQSLQLDIGAPHVNNIIDALKGLTRSEPLLGDFKSPKGPNVTAYKQVFIETLPPVLILHLKRFQYDNTGGTQKIWKKVGYPLELELPKEIFPRQKRVAYGINGLPKYLLTAVVYHHGKNASGGHYTVDVKRQGGREWIRLDDTVIRQIRSEDAAEGGSEEESKPLVTAIITQKNAASLAHQNTAIGISQKESEQDGWKQACGPGKKWSSVVNGTSSCKEKGDKFSMKDNKVAYLLFYQKI